MIYIGSLDDFYAKHKTKLRLMMALDKPPSHAKLEFGFTDSNGINYNKFAPDTAIPVERWGKIQEFQMWLSAGLSHTELNKFLQAMKDAIADGLKNNEVNVARLGACIFKMEERKNMVIHTELFYNFIAVQLIRQDEDPAVFNETIHQQKVEQFKKEVAAGNSYDFFFSLGLSKLNSFQDMSPSEWNKFWKDSRAEQEMLDKELSIIRSEKKSSPTVKVSAKK